MDTLPPLLLDRIVAQFRELFLARDSNWLHGLALVGVRAVLGIESQRGSPFNIQKSLHVPNFTFVETAELYRQYQEESGQEVNPQVVEQVHQVTQGQPGLVSWFGELLTEKYNPISDQPIGSETWEMVWHKARFAEPNNTVMNLISKARIPEYQPFAQSFSRSDLPSPFMIRPVIISTCTVSSPQKPYVRTAGNWSKSARTLRPLSRPVFIMP